MSKETRKILKDIEDDIKALISQLSAIKESEEKNVKYCKEHLCNAEQRNALISQTYVYTALCGTIEHFDSACGSL